MRRYETIFIASPTLTDEQAEELVRHFEGIIAEQAGELLKTEKWGRKKLAYEVQKFSEGLLHPVRHERGSHPHCRARAALP